ncbi:glycosyl amidation-associated protein WbuZ [Aurantivibrio plasticivorans]
MRVIARLDIKNEFVIKGIHLEGLRKVGDPCDLAKQYYENGIDELLLMDAVASLYDRNNLFHIIESACREVFIPITVGGGIRQLSDIDAALKSGADKVAINTGAVNNPDLIREASMRYGSQAIVASIEAKRAGDSWTAYVDNGREPTGKSVIEWSEELAELGAGEIIVTSIDQEGTKKGFDIDLIEQVNRAVTIPVIACGGLGTTTHIEQLVDRVQPSAIACASVFHYKVLGITDIKQTLIGCGRKVREAA